MQADLKQGRQELDALDTALDDVGESADRTSKRLDNLDGKGPAKVKQDLDAATKSAQNMDAAVDKANKSVNGMGGKNRKSPVSGLSDDVDEASDAMRRGRLSAGEYKQAMRQLPAQITDITTSLASGMPIWMVAIQQGGQLKDSFGGVKPAARALISSIKPMPLLFGGVAAAVGLAVVAQQKGANEARRYNEALILTGNIAGTSSDQLSDMARRIDDVAGTQGNAAAVLAEVARTGKVAADQIEQVSRAAIAMEIATGKAISSTIDEFVKLAEDPVQAIADLNNEYHFLDASVYSNIVALRQQGREIEAVKLAVEAYADVVESRATEISDDIGLLERAWKGVKDAASEAWDSALNIGRDRTRQQQLDDINERIKLFEELNEKSLFKSDGEDSGIKALKVQRDALAQEIEDEERLAKEKAEARQLEAEAIKAMAEVDKLTRSSLSNEEKRVEAIKAYREQLDAIRETNPSDSRLDEATVAKNIAGINERYETKDPAADRRERDAKQRQKEIESFVSQLEKQAATVGKTKEATRAYEISEKGLTGALLQRAQAANEVITSQEALLQATEDAATLDGISARLLGLQGQGFEARGRQLEQEFSKLLARLEARGDEAGKAIVRSLINVEQASAAIGDLQSQVNQVFSEQTRREQTIRAQQDAGLISELNARKQILDLHKATADQVESLLPEMQRLAEETGNPQAIERVKDLRNQMELLRISSDQFATTLRDSFQAGLSDGLVKLAKGAEDLEGVVLGVAQAIADAMLQLAAQNIAQQAFEGISGLFNSGADAAASAAGAATMTTAITTASATGAAAMGSGITAATSVGATSLGASITGSMAAGSATLSASLTASFTAGAAQIAAANAVGAAGGFAEGGYTGPGTKYQPAGIVHAGEYVQPAHVLKQPGAMAFMESFRREGMRSLARFQGYADGGLVGTAPRLSDSPAALMGQAVPKTDLHQRLLPILDDDLIASAMRGPAGEEILELHISRNPSKFRGLLNGGN